tara:strand:+ start:25 stop:567 length:543 start_codon:yes stop_codon:yes gene_type:complete
MKVEVEHSGICVSIVTETNNSPSLLGQVAERAIKDIIKSGKSENMLNEENNSDEDIEKSDDEEEDEEEDEDEDEDDEDDDTYEEENVEPDDEVILYEGTNKNLEKTILKHIKSNSEEEFVNELNNISDIVKINGTTKEQRSWVFQATSEIQNIDVWSVPMKNGQRILYLKNSNKNEQKNE